MTAATVTGILTRNEDFVSRKIAGEVLLVPIRRQCADLECIYALDEVAGFLWMMLDHQSSREELLAAVCREYEVEHQRAAADLDAFLGQLIAIGAVNRQ